MMNRFTTSLLTGIVAAGMCASVAFAQTEDPGHPRVNQLDQRLENQQERINTGVNDGQMNQGQAVRDEKRDARVQQQMTRDEAAHNGHLTKGEQHHLNHELNRNSHDIHRQRHHHKHDRDHDGDRK